MGLRKELLYSYYIGIGKRTVLSRKAVKKRSDILYLYMALIIISFLYSFLSSQIHYGITNVVGDYDLLDEIEITNDTHTDIAEELLITVDETEKETKINCNDYNQNKENGRKDVVRDKKKKKLTYFEEFLLLLKKIDERRATPAQN